MPSLNMFSHTHGVSRAQGRSKAIMGPIPGEVGHFRSRGPSGRLTFSMGPQMGPAGGESLSDFHGRGAPESASAQGPPKS